MSNKLTDKQIKFLDLVLSGVSQNEAYMSVYKVKNLNTAGVNANESLRNPKCITYLEEKRKELADKHIITREYKLQKLKEIMESPDKQSDLINAIKVANEMDGHNAPVKSEQTIKQNIEDLSTDELIKRAEAIKIIERNGKNNN